MITSKWLMFLRGFHGFIDRSRDFAGSKVQLVQNAREALRYKTLVLYDQDTRMVLCIVILCVPNVLKRDSKPGKRSSSKLVEPYNERERIVHH